MIPARGILDVASGFTVVLISVHCPAGFNLNVEILALFDKIE